MSEYGPFDDDEDEVHDGMLYLSLWFLAFAVGVSVAAGCIYAWWHFRQLGAAAETVAVAHMAGSLSLTWVWMRWTCLPSGVAPAQPRDPVFVAFSYLGPRGGLPLDDGVRSTW